MPCGSPGSRSDSLSDRGPANQDRDEIMLGDAWRQYAGALVSSGEYYDAKEACDHASVFYTSSGNPVFEQALLALIEGQAIFHLGHQEAALAMIDAAARQLHPLSRTKYVSARTMHGAALLGMNRIAEASRVFEEAAGLAKADNDTRALAYIVHNIGVCYSRSGDTARAREYLASASDEYARLGLKA